jgi:hypothetical protein
MFHPRRWWAKSTTKTDAGVRFETKYDAGVAFEGGGFKSRAGAGFETLPTYRLLMRINNLTFYHHQVAMSALPDEIRRQRRI